MDEAQQLPPPVTGRDVALILRRRGKIAALTFLVVVTATIGLTSLMKPVYEARARVLIDNPGQGAIPGNILELLNGGGGLDLSTEMEVLRSRGILSEVIRKGRLKTDPDELSSRLTLDLGPSGRVLILGVRAKTGEEAARVANLFARIYKENTRFERQRAADEATLQLRKGLVRAEADKKAAVLALNTFMKQAGTSDPGALYNRRAAQTEETQVALDSSRTALKAEQRRREKLAAQLKTLAPTIITGYTQVKNPVIDNYRAQLYDLNRRRKELLLDYTPESDEVQKLDADIAAVNASITRALESEYSVGSKNEARNHDYSNTISGIINAEVTIETTQAHIRANESLLARLRAEQKVLADRRTRYEDLLRRQNSAVGKYEQLRQGITEVDLRRFTEKPTARVLDQAMVPKVPVSPRPLLNGLMAVFLGGFLAIAMALLAEYLASGDDDRVGMPRVAGVPLLGSLPMALPPPGEAGLPVPVRGASSRHEDDVREVGYALAHLRHDPKAPAPVVLIVPTRTDEGGAALAAQLAATLVRDGLRVTLVDADRARPRLNRVFGAPDAPGLADVLAGRVQVGDSLHVGVDGGLRFLAAGSPADATPTTEQGLRRVFRDLRADTDLVLVSGPSVFSVPVLAPLQKASDGVVLVTPPDVLPSQSVARARRLLTNGRQPTILGVVVGEAAAPDAAAAAARDEISKEAAA